MADPQLTKAQREVLWAMFGGRCAYCGRDLPARWHADHVEPVVRVEGVMLHPQRNRPDNFMPACPPCNIDKHAMTPEAWKKWLATRLAALEKTPGFRLLASLGLIQATGAPIVFHYEAAGRAALDQGGGRG